MDATPGRTPKKRKSVAVLPQAEALPQEEPAAGSSGKKARRRSTEGDVCATPEHLGASGKKKDKAQRASGADDGVCESSPAAEATPQSGKKSGKRRGNDGSEGPEAIAPTPSPGKKDKVLFASSSACGQAQAEPAPEQLSPLLAAAEGGDAAAVSAALAAEGSGAVGTVSRGGYTALHLAAAGSHADVVSALLEARAEPGRATKFGQTALHHAVLGSAPTRCVEELLRGRANVCTRDGTGTTRGLSALELALRGGSSGAVVELLQAAAKDVKEDGLPAANAAASKKLPALPEGDDVDSVWELLSRRVKTR